MKKLASDRNSSPSVKLCKDSHGMMKDHQPNKVCADKVVHEVSYPEGRYTCWSSRQRSWVSPPCSNQEREGTKKKMENQCEAMV